jgi:hypothetical protein
MFAMDSLGFVLSNLFLIVKTATFVKKKWLNMVWSMLLLALISAGVFRLASYSTVDPGTGMAFRSKCFNYFYVPSMVFRLPLFLSQLLIYAWTSACLAWKMRKVVKMTSLPLARQLEQKSLVMVLLSLVLWTVLGVIPIFQNLGDVDYFFIFLRQCLFGGLLLYTCVLEKDKSKVQYTSRDSTAFAEKEGV